MDGRGVLTRVLAVAGTVLVWVPVVLPVVFWLGIGIRSGNFIHLDFMIPAEIFWVVLVGAGLLIWAGLRARSGWRFVVVSLGVAILFLVTVIAFTAVTGLASGATEPTPLLMGVSYGLLILFDLAVVATGLGGIFLLKNLFTPSRPAR